MALLTINKQPTRRELNWFGILFVVFFALIGGLVWWRFGAASAARWIWIGAAAIAIVYYAVPTVRRPIYLGWLYAAYPIGWTLSHLILASVYYLVLTPIGLLARLVRYDPMKRKIEPEATGYWIERQHAADHSRYFQQF